MALSLGLICTKRVQLGLSEVAFIEGCPHVRGDLYEGFHCSESFESVFEWRDNLFLFNAHQNSYIYWGSGLVSFGLKGFGLVRVHCSSTV